MAEKQTEASKKLREIELAYKREKDWRDEGEITLKIHDGKRRFRDDKQGNTFNILWANTDTKRQAIYSANPQPDIRKRWKVADKAGDAASELMERVATCILDSEETEDGFRDNVLDMLLPGRAVLRVRYESEMDGDEIGRQRVNFEPWLWDRFSHGPCKKWSKVPWICYEHRMTKKDVKEKWPDFVERLSYEEVREDEEKKEEGQIIYEEAIIYEMWHKKDRKVYWLAKGFKDEFLEVEEDPLELRRFFPSSKPLYAVETSHTLIPQTEFSKYKILAEELETVSFRLNMIVNAIRVRGVYDRSLSEVEGVLSSGDNELIPAENVTKFMERGGLDKAIWFLPIEMLVNVRTILEQQRESLKRQISEIIGLSDIVRGMTNPNETAAAQELKSSWASNRLEKQKQSFQKFIRNHLRIAIELVAENFTRENLTEMTGLNFPTEEEKRLVQMQLQQQEQQAMMSGQEPPEPPPKAMEILNSPSWEEIEDILQDDYSRKYRIDIETDSTVRVDEEKDKEDAGFLMKAIADFSATAGTAVQAGMMTPDAATALIKSMVQKFRLGRDVVDAFSVPPKQGPSPEEQKMQMEQQKQQAEQQMKQQEFESEQQLKQMDMQIKQQESQIDMAVKRMDAQAEQQRVQNEKVLAMLEMQLGQAEHSQEMQSLERKDEYEERKHQRDMRELNAKPKPNNG